MNSSCACGYTGSLCTELLSGLSSVSDALDEACQYGDCEVVDGSATCDCDTGYDGDYCEEELVPLAWNYAITFGIPVLVFIICGFLIWKKSLPTFVEAPRAMGTRSPWRWVKPQIILGYRMVIFLFWLALLIHLQVLSGYNNLRTFTVWNGYLLLIYFALGTVISLRNLREEPSGEMTFLEKAHWVLCQIEFPTSILILLVVWLVLYPQAVSAGTPSTVVNYNSFFLHGINVGIMFIDFMLCGYVTEIWHMPFELMWGALYVFFHSFYMLARDVEGLPLDPVYSFLSTASPLLIAWLFGLLFVLAFFFMFVHLLSYLKRRCAGTRMEPFATKGESSRVEIAP